MQRLFTPDTRMFKNTYRWLDYVCIRINEWMNLWSNGCWLDGCGDMIKRLRIWVLGKTNTKITGFIMIMYCWLCSF